MQKTTFGQRMREARLNAGLTQKEAAKRAGIDQSAISLSETVGKASKHTATLAAIYGVDAYYLATGKQTRNGKETSQWAKRVAGWVDEFPEPLRQQAAWRCRGALDGFRVELEESPKPKKERVRSPS